MFFRAPAPRHALSGTAAGVTQRSLLFKEQNCLPMTRAGLAEGAPARAAALYQMVSSHSIANFGVSEETGGLLAAPASAGPAEIGQWSAAALADHGL
jgi:hypothetical protein